MKRLFTVCIVLFSILFTGCRGIDKAAGELKKIEQALEESSKLEQDKEITETNDMGSESKSNLNMGSDSSNPDQSDKLTEKSTSTPLTVVTPSTINSETTTTPTTAPTTTPTTTPTTPATTPATTPTTTPTTTVATVEYWNQEKADKLANFMVTWGNEMNQKYFEYWQGNSVDLYGLMVPDDVMGDYRIWDIAYVGETIEIEWSDNGVNKPGEYALVAIYSDAETQPANLDKHVYLFTIKDGVPIVMITMQSEGIDNRLHFYETENYALRTGFAAIVND
ncbi:MAG: DUF4767 domain-containing protein [Clostridiaceae bacterium]|nr:DUF4767 domain-containing protein [Clostridiaceae bacterium]